MFKHSADLDGELALAMTATMQADADALFRVGLHGGQAINGATVRAGFSISPDDAFEIAEGRFFIVEIGLGQNGHGLAPDRPFYATSGPCLQGI